MNEQRNGWWFKAICPSNFFEVGGITQNAILIKFLSEAGMESNFGPQIFAQQQQDDVYNLYSSGSNTNQIPVKTSRNISEDKNCTYHKILMFKLMDKCTDRWMEWWKLFQNVLCHGVVGYESGRTNLYKTCHRTGMLALNRTCLLYEKFPTCSLTTGSRSREGAEACTLQSLYQYLKSAKLWII